MSLSLPKFCQIKRFSPHRLFHFILQYSKSLMRSWNEWKWRGTEAFIKAGYLDKRQAVCKDEIQNSLQTVYQMGKCRDGLAWLKCALKCCNTDIISWFYNIPLFYASKLQQDFDTTSGFFIYICNWTEIYNEPILYTLFTFTTGFCFCNLMMSLLCTHTYPSHKMEKHKWGRGTIKDSFNTLKSKLPASTYTNSI